MWRNTREYRAWRAGVIRKDGVCQVCGSRLDRHAHHLRDASNYPEFRFDVTNGICLCKKHHIMFHTSYMDSFSEKCTEKDWYNFMELYLAVSSEVKGRIVKLILSGNKE